MKMKIKKLFLMSMGLILALCTISPNLHAQRGTPQGGVMSIKAGNSLREVQEFHKAEYYLKRGLSRMRGVSKYWEAVAHESLGILYKQLEKHAQARFNFDRAEKLYEGLGMNLSVKVVSALKEGIEVKPAFFAGIEVGSKGVKGAIVSIEPGGDGNFIYEIMHDDSDKNPGTRAGTDAAIRETAEAVKYYYHEWIDKMVQEDPELPAIKESDIMIAISSGVQESLEEKGRLEDLKESIQRAIDRSYKDIRVVNSCEEPKLVAMGIIPASSRYVTSIFDIGSGNTKGGYLNLSDDFECSSFTFGTVSLTERIQEHAKKEGISYKEAATFLEKQIKREVSAELNRVPGYTNDEYKYTCLVGGIVWAFISFTKPETRGDRLVRFTTEEVRQFKENAFYNYESLINPDLSIVPNEVVNKAERDINLIKSKIFNQQNIIAGSIILESLVEAYNGSIEPKEFYFARDGYVGWITGHIIETISKRYDDAVDSADDDDRE